MIHNLDTPTILRVRYTAGTYIAANTADSKQSVSCTMGEQAAAQAWVRKHTTDVIPSDVRPCTDDELAAIDRTHDKPGVYYFTWDIREDLPPVVVPDWADGPTGPGGGNFFGPPTGSESSEDVVEKAPAEPASLVVDLPTLRLSMHPVLDRVMLVPDAVRALSEQGGKENAEQAEDLASDWQAWIDEIRENGIIEPLRVVVEGDRYLVVEGRHRLEAASQIGLATVPCIVVEPSDILALAEGTIRGRRHWTKSQRAWFAVLMHPEIAAEDRKGSFGKNRSALNADLTDPSAFSAEGLADRYGVATRMIELAISLYRSLEKYTHLRAKYEAGLWGGKGLPGLCQGLAAETHPVNPTGPGVKIERHPVGNLRKIWTSERAHAANWGKAEESVRLNLAADLRTEAAKLPGDYLEWKLEILEGVIAELRAAGHPDDEPGYVALPE
jgi:hypothetical protein